jgi:hypothetical protein
MLSPIATTEPSLRETLLFSRPPKVLSWLFFRSVPAMNRRPTIEASILDASGFCTGLAGATPMILAEQRNNSFKKISEDCLL